MAELERIEPGQGSPGAQAGWRHASASGMAEVVVTDVHMPFWSMVWFMVKWSIAAIPAFIILFVIGAILFGLLAGIGYGLHR